MVKEIKTAERRNLTERIRITPLGGGREIGANSYLVEWKGYNILLDAGMNPTKKGTSAMMQLERVPQAVDAAIITHGHFDHMASLPYLVYEREVEKVIVPAGSVAVIDRMLANTASTARNHDPVSWSHPNYNGYRRGPLRKVFALLEASAAEYLETFPVADKLRGYFFDAGHVLGSAGVILTDGENTIGYTGDIGIRDHGIHRGAHLPRVGRLDCLIMESTTAHEGDESSQAEDWDSFFRQVSRTVQRGGQTLIPSFALGRTQDVLALLAHGKEAGKIPDVPVYLAGLGNAITGIYDNHRGSSLQKLFSSPETLAETAVTLKTPDVLSEYKRSVKEGKPSIFVATNGMLEPMTASAVLACELVKKPENTVIFPGYVSPESLGSDLKNAVTGSRLNFRDGNIPVEVVTEHRYSFSLSGHANRSELKAIADQLNPSSLILVHGSAGSIKKLKSECTAKGRQVFTPFNGETIIMEAGQAGMYRLSDSRALIITAGTSLIYGFGGFTKVRGRVPKDSGELAEFAITASTGAAYPSAELQNLALIEKSGKDHLYFLVSDSDDGRLCGEALQKWADARGRQASVSVVNGLVKDYREFRSNGLPNLVNSIVGMIAAHHGNAAILATGGFKAETAMATLVGAFYRTSVYYIHEDFSNVVEFSRFPLAPDFRLIEQQYQTIAAVLEASSNGKAENMIANNLPPGLNYLFQDKADGQGKELSPVGKVFLHLFRTRHMAAGREELVLGCSKLHQHIWGQGAIAVNEIAQPEVRSIMGRIWRNADNIQSVVLKGSDTAERRGEVHMVLKGIKGDRLQYLLKTPRGTQEIELHCYPGSGLDMLDSIGGKIYS